jgi:hypothetical protein
MIRNRIIEHVKVRAGDLVPHPLNFRTHPEEQREALAASYDQIGFARSLLGYRLDDGRIQLIDGHLRAEFDPEMEVDVEVLDVTQEEARMLLLTIDPLAALAQTSKDVHERLTQITRSDSEALSRLWQTTREDVQQLHKLREPKEAPPAQEQYLVLVECANEREQVELLRRFKSQGLKCKALMS